MFKVISIAAVISYFLPLVLVFVKKLWDDRFFVLFAIYWLVGGVINVTDFTPGISPKATLFISLIYNMLDIPFILFILYYTSNSILVRKFTTAAIAVSALITVTGILLKGFNYDALKYSLGVGIGLVLVIIIWEIIRYLQKIEHSNRQNAKIFIYAALLFEYATFILIYVFDYFIDSTNTEDNFLIYYISSLVAIFIASCGFLLFKKYRPASVSHSLNNTSKERDWLSYFKD